MYLTSGCNVFGQWLSVNSIIRNFTPVPIETIGGVGETENDCINLVDIQWSYNIYQHGKKIFLSGAWMGEKDTVIKIKLPEELIDNYNTYRVTGNGDFIILCESETCKFWKLNLEDGDKWNWQRVPIFFNNEFNCDNDKPKRRKSACAIAKVVTKGTTCLCLTNSGSVYEIPQRVDTRHCVGTICDIDCGYEHKIALTDTGRVYTWGNGRRCQLGHGDLNSSEEPTEVEALAGVNIVKVAAGGWHSLALSDSGDVYTWGWNNNGQLGICEKDGEVTAKSYPTLVDLYDKDDTQVELNVIDIACGSRHSVVLLSDNSVWTTGLNHYGQLGLCTESVPVLNSYKKVYECKEKCSVCCGPWSTVIIENNAKVA